MLGKLNRAYLTALEEKSIMTAVEDKLLSVLELEYGEKKTPR
ncbi:hypothetical protein [uncultured Nostoc sp.]